MGRGRSWKHCPLVRTFLPPVALPIPFTPSLSRQEDTLSSGQHKMCHFWNKAARLSRSEMPSAFWSVPRTVIKHVANGSLKGPPKGIRTFCFSWEMGSSKALRFQGPQHKGKKSRFFYTTSSEKVGSALLRASSKFNLSVMNCQGLFSTDRLSVHCPQVVKWQKRES